jgi:hypothetical protein
MVPESDRKFMDPEFCRACNCHHPQAEHTSLPVKIASRTWNFYFIPLWQLAQGPLGLVAGGILIVAVLCAVLGPSGVSIARFLLNIWLALMFVSALAPFFVKYLPPRLFHRQE